MFPLPIIFTLALWRKDDDAWIYVLPLSLIGFAIAAYQTMLQWGWLNYDPNSCSTAVSCAEAQIELFGFMTIPFGSMLVFLALLLLTLLKLPRRQALKSIFDEQNMLASFKVIMAIASLAALVVVLV